MWLVHLFHGCRICSKTCMAFLRREECMRIVQIHWYSARTNTHLKFKTCFDIVMSEYVKQVYSYQVIIHSIIQLEKMQFVCTTKMNLWKCTSLHAFSQTALLESFGPRRLGNEPFWDNVPIVAFGSLAWSLQTWNSYFFGGHLQRQHEKSELWLELIKAGLPRSPLPGLGEAASATPCRPKNSTLLPAKLDWLDNSWNISCVGSTAFLPFVVGPHGRAPVAGTAGRGAALAFLATVCNSISATGPCFQVMLGYLWWQLCLWILIAMHDEVFATFDLSLLRWCCTKPWQAGLRLSAYHSRATQEQAKSGARRFEQCE